MMYSLWPKQNDNKNQYQKQNFRSVQTHGNFPIYSKNKWITYENIIKIKKKLRTIGSGGRLRLQLQENLMILWSGRSPEEGSCNPLQYSCLENPMDRGAWRATIHSVSKSWTRLKQLSMQVCAMAIDIRTVPSFQKLPTVLLPGTALYPTLQQALIQFLSGYHGFVCSLLNFMWTL